MATAAPQAPTMPRVPPLSGTWTIEQRRFLGFIGGALCLGIIVGAKLGRGTTEVKMIPGPCADCAEREIQAQRAAARNVPGAPVRPLPGDVPPVAFTPPPTGGGVGAASTDISGMPTDTSKGYVADPSFITPEGSV